jgi:hypothetical protein
MAQSVEEVIYDDMARAIDRQSRAVDECRNRASIVIAANGVTAGFLATVAIKDGLGCFAYFAIIMTALCAAVGTRILIPARDAWKFAPSATILLEDHVDVEERNELKAFYRYRAVEMEGHFDANQKRLNSMFAWLTAACLAFVVDMALWLGEIAFT